MRSSKCLKAQKRCCSHFPPCTPESFRQGRQVRPEGMGVQWPVSTSADSEERALSLQYNFHRSCNSRLLRHPHILALRRGVPLLPLTWANSTALAVACWYCLFTAGPNDQLRIIPATSACSGNESGIVSVQSIRSRWWQPEACKQCRKGR